MIFFYPFSASINAQGTNPTTIFQIITLFLKGDNVSLMSSVKNHVSIENYDYFLAEQTLSDKTVS